MNMVGNAVHLIANAIHPSGDPDVLYMIISVVHFMQYTQVGLKKYSMASAVHMMATIVYPSVAPDVR